MVESIIPQGGESLAVCDLSSGATMSVMQDSSGDSVSAHNGTERAGQGSSNTVVP